MKTIVFILSIVALMACQKPEPILPEYNAEVLSYDSRKCYCKFGWLIKIGNDTLLTTSQIMKRYVGYNVHVPIKVIIDVEITDEICRYPYCEVFYISLVDYYN